MEALRVISSPKQTMEVMVAKRRVAAGFGVVAAAAAVGLVGATISALGGVIEAQLNIQGMPGPSSPGAAEGATRAAEVLSLALAALLPFAWWVSLSSVVQLATRILGGRGPFSGTLAVVGAAFVPFLVLGAVGMLAAGFQVVLGPASAASFAVGLAGLPLVLAALAWHAALVVVGIRFSRGLSYGRAGGAFGLSVAVLPVLAVLSVVVLVVLAAALAGAPTGA